MGSRERPVDVGLRRGRELTATVLRELHLARVDRNLSGAALAAELGISGAQYSRIERGLVRGLSIEQASAMLAAVGFDLSMRVYPGGQPLRDRAHAALLDRLRREMHRSLRVLTEVPFPTPGDQRAWDLVAVGQSWRHGFEAERGRATFNRSSGASPLRSAMAGSTPRACCSWTRGTTVSSCERTPPR